MSKRTIAATAALGLAALLPLTGAQGAGVEGNGDSTTACSGSTSSTCTVRTISADGSRVVFSSESTNLVDGDTNGFDDVFLAVVAADGSHTLTRISVPDALSGGTGTQGNAGSAGPAVSPSGEWVAFESDAGNLVGGDENDLNDVFLYHVPTGRLSRVSVTDAGAEADGESFAPSVADDGTVAFTSSATNLVTAGVPAHEAVYVRRANPANTLIAAPAPAADGPSGHASISADGSRVAFASEANLDILEDPGHEADIFVWVVGADLRRITTDASAVSPSLRADGQSVAFVADDVDADGLDDVLVAAVDSPVPVLTGSSGRGPSLASGDRVAYVVDGQVWLRDGGLSLVSAALNGPANDESRAASLADNGRVVFSSDATNLVTGDGNDSSDVFLRLAAGTLMRLSERPAGAATPPTTPVTTPPTTAPTNIDPFQVPPVVNPPAFTGVVRTGYWMLDDAGNVYGFGTSRVLGSPVNDIGNTHSADIEPTPSGKGYWVTDRRGRVYSYGDAAHYGNADRISFGKDEKVTSISSTATGRGYWIFTTQGRVLAHGDAVHYGDLSEVKLNGPVLDSIPTASGKGYYMVASDGGIFTFGDARFYGSLGSIKLNAPVQSLVPDGDGVGYWLVASDGGVFTFETAFRGSLGSTKLNKPVTGMVPFGNGYLMVAEDGGIFNFSNLPFLGSLGDKPPAEPVVSVAVR
ncbi:MAG: TolB family protein [Acidimicrobiia bacterium]